ncbi:T9SS type A sorting domain-containing protein [Polaribacter staleyi]|uniref:T9SS type A sorting domain-containing protein n=1 Tax=Polaribacter staleyi TaxID=2022337 RepID=UPI0031BAC550
MKKRILKTFLFLGFTFFALSLSAQTFTFSSGLEGWSASFGSNGAVTHAATEGVANDGALQLNRTTDNANFGIKVGANDVTETGIDADATKFIRIKYKNGTKGTSIRIGGKNVDDAAIKTDNNKNVDFNILAPDSNEYVVSYIDMSDIALWKGTITNFYIMVRKNSASDTGDFFLDEIEFLTSMPAATFSEFIKNPSFDGPTGTAHLTGDVDFATRGLTTTEFHDGGQSLGFNFSADATKPFWNFTLHEKTYPSVYTAGSDIQIKMWVKTNRVAPIKISSRVKLSLGGTEIDGKPIATVSTTNTTMDWEELTFNIEVTEDFDGIIFWFGIDWTDDTEGEVVENLNAGDMVYIDQMTATLTLDNVLNVENNVLDGTNVYVNNKTQTLNVKAPLNSSLEMYNILGSKVKDIQKLNENSAVSLAGMTSGIYIVRVTSEGKSKTKKVIVK